MAGVHAMESKGPCYRKVGLICANLSDFHGLVTEHSTDEAVAAQSALASIVEASAQNERGLIDTFQGDHFVVTFNVARSSANIGRAAALCALQMSAAVGQESLLGGRSLSMGFAAGRALVGNMGTGAMKRLCTVGPVYGEAVALERLARHVGQRCLVSERSIDGVEMVAYTHLVGRARLAKGGDMVNVRAIMILAAVNGDEWLYEMVQAASSNPLGACNSAMAHYLKGEAFDVPEKGEEGISATGIYTVISQNTPNVVFVHPTDNDPNMVRSDDEIESKPAPLDANPKVNAQSAAVVATCRPTTDEDFIEIPMSCTVPEVVLRWAKERVVRLVAAGEGYAHYDLCCVPGRAV
eukprot:GILI01015328.1.p1 GENE.GILI01015328.1~~GILI01015328.1.p1  ORF type:complete len:352 (-),score=70.74 GILI01015328.1:524-1579(-)